MSLFDKQFIALSESLDEVSRLAGDTAAALQGLPWNPGVEQPTADPAGEVGRARLGIGMAGSIKVGVVADCVPHARFYRVMSGQGPLIPCCALASGSTNPLGVAGGTTYQPRTAVVFLQLPGTSYGVILGALPWIKQDNRYLRPDAIYQGNVTGLTQEQVHQAPLQMRMGGGIHNFSCRTPIDSTETGELHHVASTGILLHVDDFMAQLRVDEETGLFLFYMDQLTRLSGRNLEILSASHALRTIISGDRLSIEEGFSFTDAESSGLLTAGLPRFRETNGERGLAALEPGHDRAMAFARFLRYYGQLGQGYRQQMLAPPPLTSWYTSEASAENPVGLSEEVWTAHGSAGLRSSGMFFIGRHPNIPAPKKTGNSVEAAEVPPRQHIPLQATENLPAGVAAALGYQDLRARLFNWESVYGFVHDDNYRIPSEAEGRVRSNSVPPSYSDLKEKQFLEPPTPDTVSLGPDAGEVEVYPVTAGLTVLPDGGYVLEDGYGTTITSTGGSLFVDAPGDITIRAGRRLILEGTEVITRGKNAVDTTCSTGSIRSKAETDHHMIVANGGGAHGLLVDCRATETTANLDAPGTGTNVGGIVFNAPNSQVVSLGRNQYLRTTNGGDIVLDSDRGGGRVVLHAQDILNFVASRLATYFGAGGGGNAIRGADEPASAAPSAVLTANGCTLPGNLYSEGGVYSGGPGVFTGGVRVYGGHVYTTEAEGFENKVPTIQGEPPTPPDMGDGDAAFDHVFNVSPGYYGEDGIGADGILDKMRASLRTRGEYGAESYIIVAPPWAVSGAGDTWSEPVVLGPNDEETYPFPGLGSPTMVTVDTTVFDRKSGIAKPQTQDNYGPPPEGNTETVLPRTTSISPRQE